MDAVVAELRALGARVETGKFGADMKVALVNDGPDHDHHRALADCGRAADDWDGRGLIGPIGAGGECGAAIMCE